MPHAGPPYSSEELLAEARWLRRFAYRLVRDPDAADDLAQAVWLKALERRPAASEPGGLRAWLARVTRNLVIRRWRDEGVRASHARLLVVDSSTEVAHEHARVELQQRLAAAVSALPEPYRSAVILRHVRELSYEQIAAQLQITEAAARKRTSRGLALLRERLDGEFGGEQVWREAFSVFLLLEREPRGHPVLRLMPWAAAVTGLLAVAAWIVVQRSAPDPELAAFICPLEQTSQAREALAELAPFYGRWGPPQGGAGEALEYIGMVPDISVSLREFEVGPSASRVLSEGLLGWHPGEQRLVYLQFNPVVPTYKATLAGHVHARDGVLDRDYEVFENAGGSSHYRDRLSAEADGSWQWRLEYESQPTIWTTVGAVAVERTGAEEDAAVDSDIAEAAANTRSDDDAIRALEPYLGQWRFIEDPDIGMDFTWGLARKVVRVKTFRYLGDALVILSDGLIGWHYGDGRLISIEFASDRLIAGHWHPGDAGSLRCEATWFAGGETGRRRDTFTRTGPDLKMESEITSEGRAPVQQPVRHARRVR